MIDIKHKRECCGCEACVQVCPKNCIDLSADSQGFLYPVVSTEFCIDCGLCENVCPVINKAERSKKVPASLYAVKSTDDFIREQSSSGGFFSQLADFVLSKEGVVYGAAFDDDFNVCHIRVDKITDLPKLRGSKYVQSRIGHTFSQCKNDLKEGKLVLFTGTPCQISALGHFLSKEYDNLIKVEVVCHGVPSPMLYQQYLKETIIQDIEDRTITKVSFRTKLGSWKKYFFTVEYEERGKIHEYRECITDSLYMKGFLNDLFIRPSCFECRAKNFSSGADFTIADFWGQEYTFPEFDDDKGVSAVFVNTIKAQRMFDYISVLTIERPFSDFIKYNPSLVKSPKKTLLYSRFWSLYGESNDVRSSIEETFHVDIFSRILHKFKIIFTQLLKNIS